MGKEQFLYWITKNGRIFVYWHGATGKREIVLRGAPAGRLIRELPGMDANERQLARATGNFKRGNERRRR